MENQRIHPRIPISLSIEIRQTLSGNKEIFIAGRAKNLSLGGVGFFSDVSPQEGAPINVTLFLVEDEIEDANTAELHAQGHVIWTAPVDGGGYEAGIRFVGLGSQEQKRLEHYLRRLQETA